MESASILHRDKTREEQAVVSGAGPLASDILGPSNLRAEAKELSPAVSFAFSSSEEFGADY